MRERRPRCRGTRRAAPPPPPRNAPSPGGAADRRGHRDPRPCGSGMRAPRNTNQFLMREKYRLLHLRPGSPGTGTGDGAEGGAARAEPSGPEPPREDSQQYCPSEDDVIRSERFMQRDFDEFCSSMA